MIRRRRASAFPRIAKYVVASNRLIVAENGSGQVSPRLRRQLGNALANIFSEVGTKLYSDSILEIKKTMEKLFNASMEELQGQVKAELGLRGLKKSSLLFKTWIQELTDELIQKGMKEVSGSLEDLASTAAAKYPAKGQEEGEEDLFGEEEQPEDVEEVAEEPVAPAEEVPGEGEGEGMEDLFPEEPEAALPGGAPAAPAAPMTAPAPAATHDPFAPRRWKKVGPQKVKVAEASTSLTVEQLVEAAGGHKALSSQFGKAPDVISHLQKVQTQMVKKLAQAYKVVESVSPLQLMDYANQHWPH